MVRPMMGLSFIQSLVACELLRCVILLVLVLVLVLEKRALELE